MSYGPGVPIPQAEMKEERLGGRMAAEPGERIEGGRPAAKPEIGEKEELPEPPAKVEVKTEERTQPPWVEAVQMPVSPSVDVHTPEEARAMEVGRAPPPTKPVVLIPGPGVEEQILKGGAWYLPSLLY